MFTSEPSRRPLRATCAPITVRLNDADPWLGQHSNFSHPSCPSAINPVAATAFAPVHALKNALPASAAGTLSLERYCDLHEQLTRSSGTVQQVTVMERAMYKLSDIKQAKSDFALALESLTMHAHSNPQSSAYRRLIVACNHFTGIAIAWLWRRFKIKNGALALYVSSNPFAVH